ncbi:MAG: class I SAM-dependent methyltransferase [Planctomycetota bacterium]
MQSRRGLRVTERLLVEALPSEGPATLLAGLDTEGAVAIAARSLWGAAPAVSWFHLDAYIARKVEGVLSRNGAKDVKVLLATDLPGVAVPGEPEPAQVPGLDLIALPFPTTGEALLGRELIEESHAALRQGGRLLAATDNAKGDWLRKVLKEIFGGKVGIKLQEKRGVVYVATRTRERAEVRDHRHTVKLDARASGDGAPRTLELGTRPGVFGNARLDAGTRALAERLDVREGERVLDLGCGYGPLGLAAALRAREAVLVDSNARAVLLAGRNAAANGLANVQALLRADLEGLEGPFDLALANPPYFSNFRIARAFVERASQLLRRGGRLALVAKAAEEHAAIVRELIGEPKVELSPGGYGIISVVKL